MKITKETAKKLYEESPIWFKDELEREFGKETFNKKHFTDFKTYEDACEEQDINPQAVYFVNDTPDVIAYKKLKIIVKAINQGWKPNWKNDNEQKWYPWFVLSSGFGFSDSNYDCTCTDTDVGSRLCFESKEKSDYAAQQFIEIYKEFLT